MITTEGAFAATMQMDIQKISEEIKQLDKAGEIRQTKAGEMK
jgi:hypothetical protein